MKEIEVKILDVDRPVVEKKLIELGAKKIFDDEIYAIVFDKNGELDKRDIMFRVRKEGEKAVVTLKGPKEKGEAKIREETEVVVGDFDTMHKIIKLLGYESERITRKHRVSFALDGVHFDFDKYHDDLEFIPEFMEIEAEDITTIHEYAAKLGFTKEQCTPYHLSELLRHYSKIGKSNR